VSIITRAQREYLTYWSVIDEPGNANRHGELQYGVPAEIKCRWDDRVQEIMKDDQTMVLSRVELITEIRLKPGDIVMRIRLAEVPYQYNPKDNIGAYEVLKVSGSPDLRYKKILYEAFA
jgi:hypothetical protein